MNDPELYVNVQPMTDVHVAEFLSNLRWSSRATDVIMDVGCGPGYSHRAVLNERFNVCKRVVALDISQTMVDYAAGRNRDHRIEFAQADIDNWLTVSQWEGTINKLFSFNCLHYVKDQTNSLNNIFRLLAPGGKAAIFFDIHARYWDAIMNTTYAPAWREYFDIENLSVPDSHLKDYQADYYKELVNSIGFQTILCEPHEMKTHLPTIASARDYFSAICPLLGNVPPDLVERFKRDLLESNLRYYSRLPDGQLRVQNVAMRMVLKKSSAYPFMSSKELVKQGPPAWSA